MIQIELYNFPFRIWPADDCKKSSYYGDNVRIPGKPGYIDSRLDSGYYYNILGFKTGTRPDSQVSLSGKVFLSQ